jgi:hypothetical protein
MVRTENKICYLAFVLYSLFLMLGSIVRFVSVFALAQGLERAFAARVAVPAAFSSDPA